MPADMKFSQRKDGLPVYEDDTGEYRIEKGSAVRIKIVGIRLAADHIGVIGSIKDDYLG